MHVGVEMLGAISFLPLLLAGGEWRLSYEFRAPSPGRALRDQVTAHPATLGHRHLGRVQACSGEQARPQAGELTFEKAAVVAVANSGSTALQTLRDHDQWKRDRRS